MRRIYVIVGVLVLGGFLSLYIPERLGDEEDFRLEGPGRLVTDKAMKAITWRPFPQAPSKLGIIRDQGVVNYAISVLQPHYSRWRRTAYPPHNGTLITFSSSDSHWRLSVRFGPNFAACGQFVKFMDSATVANLHHTLISASDIIDQAPSVMKEEPNNFPHPTPPSRRG